MSRDKRWSVDEMRSALLALPIGTVVKVGHRFPDTGNLQGSHYMRAGQGLRYVGPERDDNTASTLHNQVSRADDFEVVASPAIAPPAAVTDAARLRSLAATFDSHLNRDKTYTGAQVAAMLRDGEG